MPLPDYLQHSLGTAIVYGETGGSGVTHGINCSGLTNGTARQGAYADLGATFEPEYLVEFSVETGATAPVAGNTIDLYLLSSNDTAAWPAKANGTDASYTLGTSDANLRQAGPMVVSLVCTNDANTILRQAPVVWRPRGRYVAPIVDNNSGQTLATSNDLRIILTPLRTAINE